MRSNGQKRSFSLKLEAALLERDVRLGFAILDESFAAGLRLNPADPGGFDMLVALAQWVDLGYRTLDFFDQHLRPFQDADASKLGASDYFTLKLAESFRMLAGQQPAQAKQLLHALLGAGEPLFPRGLRFAAHFWKGRAHRQTGDFPQALAEINIARVLAEEMSAEKLVAVAKIHESWLMFHQGERKQAFDLLDEAERVLQPTGHALSLGNIAAARGRFVRHSGHYARALTHFESAIAMYRESYPYHPNLARALVNAAYLKRLIALEMRAAGSERATAARHSRVLKVVRDAMDLLRQAEQIYARHQHQGGSGSVLINLGHLQLESGDIDSALVQAEAAYRLGEEKRDTSLMSRARILQAYVQMALSDEGIENLSTSFSPAQQAVHLAEEAISLACQTQNRRLIAGAYITRGLTATDASIANWALAEASAAKAEELLGDSDHDHLTQELRSLKRRIAQSQHAHQVLQSWFDGQFGGKTFQQIEEEFAEMIVPKAWSRLGRSVSRVAQELSMSPKKVRRILRNANLADIPEARRP